MVTIIVLLLLAGISIQMLTGDNGVLQRAAEAKENTEQSQIEEQRRLASMEAAINVTETTFQGIKIPAGFSPTRIEGESTVEDGLVITDSKGNEFVWVEVPNDGTGPVYTAVESEDEDSENYYTALATALRNYCNSIITKTDGTELLKDYTTTTAGFKDEWYSGCGIEEPTAYTTLYNKMLKSVYENGGFWIGRYEAGTSNPRRAATDPIDGLIPLSKANLYPLNYVTCSQAQNLANSFTTNGKTASLLFGIQWDLVLKYLNVKGVETNLLTSDSTTWGNYYNNTYNGTDTNSWYSKDHGASWTKGIYSKSLNESVLLTTGAHTSFSKQNIYDLAGNVYEWTLEKSSSSRDSRTYRGGHCYGLGYRVPASDRYYYFETLTGETLGFRVSLY